MNDLRSAKSEVIIESPFISAHRMRSLLPMFKLLKSRRVNIVINTRDPVEHEEPHRKIAAGIIGSLQHMGIVVLYTVNHHRKLAILDNKILWEGSLNILSNYDSCVIMRRIESERDAQNMKAFTGLNMFLGVAQND